jgi:hypothetical protein
MAINRRTIGASGLLTLLAVLAIDAERLRADDNNRRNPSLMRSLNSREIAAKTVQYKWRTTESRTTPVGMAAFGGEPGLRPKTVSKTYERLIELNGDMVRFEDGAPQWDLDNQEYLASAQIKTVNGQAGKSFSRLTRANGKETVQGLVGDPEKSANRFRSQLDLAPLLDHFRPSWRLQKQLLNAEQQAERGTVEGRECAVFRDAVKTQTSVRATTYWIDPSRDNSIVRVLHEVNGKVLLQDDRQYKEWDNFGWVLSGWRYVESFEDGSLRRAVEATVTGISINEPILEGRFDIEFPRGTAISDSRRRDP